MKNIIEENEKITVNTKEIEILKKYFPNCFNKNGEFQMDKFEKRISKEVDVTKEGYELRWLGKNYARLLANIETETMIVDDEEHNNKRENKNSENIYIEGDNIDVLKHLKNAYSEKIKMIYIDPPYNTGSDGFVYKDDRKYTKEDLAELTNITEENEPDSAQQHQNTGISRLQDNSIDICHLKIDYLLIPPIRRDHDGH